MRVFLDDVRSMPVDCDILCRTVEEVIALLDAGKVDFISFDHDLGIGQMTGYQLALEIEKRAAKGVRPPKAYIHSANPVGKENIRMAMNNAHKIWNERYGSQV